MLAVVAGSTQEIWLPVSSVNPFLDSNPSPVTAPVAVALTDGATVNGGTVWTPGVWEPLVVQPEGNPDALGNDPYYLVRVTLGIGGLVPPLGYSIVWLKISISIPAPTMFPTEVLYAY